MESFGTHNARILRIEEDLAVLSVRVRAQPHIREHQESLQSAQTQLMVLKKEKQFVEIRKQLIQRSLVLPELQFPYPEFHPLNDLDISKRYPTKYIESDFVMEKEMSPRVLLASNSNGIKCVLKKFTVSEDRSLLRHAVEILGRMAFHPNILKLESIVHGSTNDILYLEHPYYELGDLAQWRVGPHFDSTRLPKLFFDMVKGLQALHDQGILHRDLKPQNILVHSTGAVLCDFDASEFQVPQSHITVHSSTRFYGTTDFVDIEVLKTSKHTIQSDLYSLGVTMGHVLAGCPYQVIKTAKGYRDLSSLNQHQKDLVSGLLDPAPEKRTPLLQVLRNPFVRGDQVGQSTNITTTTTRVFSYRKRIRKR
jgi:serine/threonine protein kinase